MNSTTIAAIMAGIAPAVRRHVEISMQGASERIAGLERRLEQAVQALADLKSAPALDAGDVARQAASLIPLPKDGEKGADADMDALRDYLDGAVSKAIAVIPAPENGKTPSREEVQPIVDEAVAAAVAALPKPQDGKDADMHEFRRMLEEMVGAMPVPQNGTSVTVDDVRDLINDAARKAVDEIPRPQDGKSVDENQVRAMVDAAVAAIPAPRDGEHGRDALAIELQPSIDESKTYPRGTYATHLGGLWRAYESTKGMRGWECIVDGVAELRIEQDGDRGMKAVAVLASGAATEKSITVPAMIYRGVFTPGEYQPGDTVTWGGSLWHCDAQTADKPGELGSKGWTLAAKRGRDGKDGKDGRDVTAPVRLEPAK